MTDLTPEAHERPEDDELLRDDLEDLAGELVATGEAAQTGHAAVDEVLRSLQSLDDKPVDEHVAVFEQAHEQLRRTLSGAGEDES
jgi:polyhydroxyalkanoate synthesis regulator phasin